MTTKTPADIKPRQFNEKIPNLVIYVNEIKKGLWENVFVQDNSNSEESKIIIAKKGRFLSDQENREAFIDFVEGVIYSFSTRNPKETRIGYFSRSTEKLDPESIFPTFKFEKRIREY